MKRRADEEARHQHFDLVPSTKVLLRTLLVAIRLGRGWKDRIVRSKGDVDLFIIA